MTNGDVLIKWMETATHYDETDGFYAPSEMKREEFEEFIELGRYLLSEIKKVHNENPVSQ